MRSTNDVKIPDVTPQAVAWQPHLPIESEAGWGLPFDQQRKQQIPRATTTADTSAAMGAGRWMKGANQIEGK
ncbi:MAG: hypothetical protein DMG64_00810 [Acidobacteria bacterium]|nr:MAG: hypothetical protein DMG64_00810 [Acidobacteriota bacterium]PYY22576.1 MAG: hypothetical protein DMG62_12675 [Acidobacteriota bacterium]